jgi:hypothetical protein
MTDKRLCAKYEYDPFNRSGASCPHIHPSIYIYIHIWIHTYITYIHTYCQVYGVP